VPGQPRITPAAVHWALLALFGPEAPASDCLFAEVKRTSRFRSHPTPACNATVVTLAPTDNGALRANIPGNRCQRRANGSD
jgi:hypothetical protein